MNFYAEIEASGEVVGVVGDGDDDDTFAGLFITIINYNEKVENKKFEKNLLCVTKTSGKILSFHHLSTTY